jgi:hypothetical protein
MEMYKGCLFLGDGMALYCRGPHTAFVDTVLQAGLYRSIKG